MKLTEEIKKRIDEYFDNISPEELYEVAVNKYGFKENIDIDLDNQSFDIVEKSFYYSDMDNSIDLNNNGTMPLAA